MIYPWHCLIRCNCSDNTCPSSECAHTTTNVTVQKTKIGLKPGWSSSEHEIKPKRHWKVTPYLCHLCESQQLKAQTYNYTCLTSLTKANEERPYRKDKGTGLAFPWQQLRSGRHPRTAHRPQIFIPHSLKRLETMWSLKKEAKTNRLQRQTQHIYTSRRREATE